MSWWLEVWTRPGHATFGRLLEDLPYTTSSYHEGINQIGDGTTDLPLDFDPSTLIDASIPSGSLLRLVHDSDPDDPRGEWLTTQAVPETDATDPTTEAKGVGMNSALAYARLEPFDWDGTDFFVSRDPDWLYGGRDIVVNGGLEDNPFTIPNFGFEDGTRIPWWPGQVEAVSANAAITTVNVDTGTYALAVTPLRAEGGASTTMTLWPANFYTVTARVRGAAGVDYQIGAQSSYETMNSVFGNSTLFPFFGANAGQWEVRHDFVGTGAYQTVTLIFGTAGEQRSAQLNIREGEAVLNGATFYIDEVSVTGFGAGAAPWEPTGTQKPNVLGPVPTFQVSNSQANTGTWSLFVTADPGNGAFQRILGVKPGVTYTASVAVGHASAASLWALEAVDVQGNLLGQDSATVPTNAWTPLQFTFTVPDFLPGADAEILLRVINYDPVQRSVFIDDLVFFQGNPPATIGQILLDVYADATVDHPGRVVWDDAANPGTPWLTPDFDAVNDSGGVPWPGPIEIRLPMRYSYSQIQADLVRQYQVEYRIIPDNPQLGTWLWQVFQSGGMGTDESANPNVAVISGTTETNRGVVVRLPSATDVMVEGLDKTTARARDAGLIAGLGRIEASTFSLAAEDPQDQAASLIAVYNEKQLSYRFTVADPDVVPLVDYKVGDIVWVDDPPTFSGPLRVTDVNGVIYAEGTRFTVQFGSVVTTGQAAVAQAVSGLMPSDPVHRPQGAFQASPGAEPFTGSDRAEFVGGGGGGMPTLVIAASNATQFSKEKADLICDGTNDTDIYIQALGMIFAATTHGRGQIVLTEGDFYFRPGEVDVADRIHLTGVGALRTFIHNLGQGTTSSRLVSTQTDGEISNLGFFTDIGASPYLGIILYNDYGRVRNIFHQGGASVGVWMDGTQQTCSDWVLNGQYTDAAIVVNEGWIALSNVLSLRHSTTGGGDFMRITNNAVGPSTFSNLVVSRNTNVGNGIVIAGGPQSLVFSNLAISVPGKTAILIDDSSPVECQFNNAWLEGAYGIQGTDFAAPVHCQFTDMIIRPTVRGIDLPGSVRSVYRSITVIDAGEHGMAFEESNGNEITDCLIYRPGRTTDDSFDGIILAANCDRNTIQGNRIIGAATGNQPRYGINISAATCDDNVYVGNRAGPASDFATAPYNDAGTGTQDSWPGAASPQGDNFV